MRLDSEIAAIASFDVGDVGGEGRVLLNAEADLDWSMGVKAGAGVLCA